jgi:hypothetical protein
MMQLKHRSFQRVRLTVLLWTGLWMLVVPFFHVHPEADHRHGQAGHVHGGTVHTVWSPDLDGEFDNHREIDRAETLQQDAVANFAQVSHVGDGYSELTFSLLSNSTDRKQIHPLLTQTLAVTQAFSPAPEASLRLEAKPDGVSFAVQLLHDLHPRAPPRLIA